MSSQYEHLSLATGGAAQPSPNPATDDEWDREVTKGGLIFFSPSPSPSPSPPSPPLPLEIIGTIAFYLVKRFPKTVLEISLCSRKVYQAAAPALVAAASFPDYCTDASLASLLQDSQGVGKLSLVSELSLDDDTSGFLAASLLLSCRSLRKLVAYVYDSTFFRSMAISPSKSSLTFLNLALADDVTVDRDLPGLNLPSLRHLEISSSSAATENVLIALDRGQSLRPVTHLELTMELLYPENRALQLRSEDFKHGFEHLVQLAIRGHNIHRSTLVTLSLGTFGNAIESLHLDLNVPYIAGTPEDHFSTEPLPEDFRFNLSELKALSLTGAFHSTLIDAFSDPNDTPALSKVHCSFSLASVGPLPLEDYTFSHHFASRIREWTVHRRPTHTRVPWLPFFKLSQLPCFKPKELTDSTSERNAKDITTSNSFVWPIICTMRSLEKITNIKVLTRDILTCGIPCQAKLMSLVLIVSGLSEADVYAVVNILASCPSESMLYLVRLPSDRNSPAELREEFGYWDRMREEKVFGDRLGYW